MFLLFHLRLSRQPERVSEEDGSWNAATAKKSGKKDDIKNQCRLYSCCPKMATAGSAD